MHFRNWSCVAMLLFAVAPGWAEVTTHVIPAMRDTFPHPAKPPLESGLPLTDTVTIAAAGSEYESVIVALYSDKPVANLMVQVSDLAKGPITISGSAVDVRYLKWWYQAEGNDDLAHQRREGSGVIDRQYIPELLVRDDALIRPDHDKQDNIIRDIDAVRDADVLQPTSLPAGQMKQYWLTLHVPDDVPGGDYDGQIEFLSGDNVIATMKLRAAVRPFKLAPSFLEYSIYWKSRYDSYTTLGGEGRTPEQFRAEMRDLAAHGVNNPTFCNVHTLLENELAWRRELDMVTSPIYWLAQGAMHVADREDPSKARPEMVAQIEHFHRLGVREVYLYGLDEGTVAKQRGMRGHYALTRKTGAGVFTALTIPDSFGVVGDVLDVPIMAGDPFRNLDDIARYHAIGHKVFSYGNPQTVHEHPDVFRRNYGLLLWAANLDGAMPYAYQHSFGHPYIDWDGRRRDHLFAYPTVNGVIPTIHWEGFREGVDDVRYLATLFRTLGKVSGQHADHDLVKDTHRWLGELRGRLKTKHPLLPDPQPIDLDAVRAEIVERILALGKL